MKINIEKSDDNVRLPEYKREGDAGMDLRAYKFLKWYEPGDEIEDSDIKFLNLDKLVLGSGDRCLISTGLKVELPQGFELQIRPRSGLALSNGITVMNSPATIDSNYRGDIGVILVNHSATDFTINIGDRVAQMVLAKVETISWQNAKVSTSVRGEEGFGSSGIK